MRSSLPIFIFVGLALVATIGIVIFGTVTTSAVAEVNNESKEELPLTIYGMEYGLIFGLGGLLCLLAVYFALKFINR